MAEIFISYRREDAAVHAGRIYEHFKRHFGSARVFLDSGAIAAGEQWSARLAAEVASCQVVVAVIGKSWLSARLQDPTDYVRREIVTALEKNKIVIPVLVDGAELPSAGGLPQPLRPMLSNQAFWLNHQGAAAYQRDLDALTEQISTWAELPAQGATCTIVLRRLPKMSVSLSKFKVFLDDEKIGEISNDQSRKFEIAPGTHALYLESGSPMLGRLSQSASDKLSFTIRHGETKRFTCSANALRKYYIELSAEE